MTLPDRSSTLTEGVLLTSGDIARWEEEVRDYESEIASLHAKIEATQKRIELARQFAALLEAPVPEAPRRRFSLRKGTWMVAVHHWVNSATSGLSATDLREIIATDPTFSARFAESEKGYYHALSRLQKAGEIIRHKGRYYSPASFADHQKRVAAGQAVDDEAPPANSGHSPMGEAILDIVSVVPGVRGPQIIRLLRTDPEFNDALARHNTGAYNAISRLIRRGALERRDGQCFPGPAMPIRDSGSRWLLAPIMLSSGSTTDKERLI